MLTSVMKWNEDLGKRVSIIFRSIDLMKFAAYMPVSFITFFYNCLFCCVSLIYGCMFCMLLFNFSIIYSYCYVYVLLLLCMLRSGYSVSFCCFVYCFCVNVYCTTATGCQPNYS